MKIDGVPVKPEPVRVILGLDPADTVDGDTPVIAGPGVVIS